ncbi:MAG: hypothetical protein KDC24_01460 [Saprospiraceae bacterium]|nr:hypothetical protein [Saprospiraceae bacterium]
MKRIYLSLAVCLFSLSHIFSQMWDAQLQDTLYGNEWIDFSQPSNYLKIQVGANGIYRIPADLLPSDARNITANRFKLFAYGKEVPMHVTTSGNLSNNDYLEFWGEKNVVQLEKHLFKSEEEILNPHYSLFTDTSTYFLTWNGNNDGLRVTSIQNDINNPPSKETHYTATSMFMDPVASIRGGDYIGGHVIEDSQMDNEGFGTTLNKTNEFTVPIKNANLSSGNGQLIVKYVTSFNVPHNFEFHINDVLEMADSNFGFAILQDTFTITPSRLMDDLDVGLYGTNTTVNPNSNPDRLSVIFARLDYPSNFTFDNENAVEISLIPANNNRYFEITGFDLTGGKITIWDTNNNRRLEGIIENNTLKFVLPGATKAPKLQIYNQETGVQIPDNLARVSFENYLDNTGNFLFISHPKFINSSGGELQAYAAYRQSPDGGSFEPIIIDIYQLYDQFGYGIQRNPICIRNFLHFAKKNWSDSLAYLILVGKPREYIDIRSSTDLQLSHDKTFFVPTYGFNASDQLLATDNFKYVPILPVGRLAVTSPQEIGIYLKKVKDYENTQRNFTNTIESKEWTKRVVHLSGGGDASERSSIQSLLASMERIVEDGKMGADVTTFYKRTEDVIIKSQTEGLKELINSGISIITFFGHSNPSVLDFNFDDPESYNNFGKYPMMISNGCFSGNCATGVSGVGERFITAEDKGAIGYYASSGFGFTGALFDLGSAFYANQTNSFYGNSIGNILSACIEQLENKQSLSLQSLLQQTIYQGDPAIKIHAFPGPDYTIDRESVSLDPPFLNIELDSFTINLDIVDLGMTLPDTSFMVKIEHQFPDGTINLLQETRVDAPLNRSNYSFKVPFIGGEEAIGQNRILVTVDNGNEIAELPTGAENNNELRDNFGTKGIETYIVSNDVVPLSPFKFAMTPNGTPTLSASTISFFPEVQTFVFEMDTLRTFSSDWKLREKVDSRGGLIKWQPQKALENGTVYYWRVSPDSTGISGGLRWQESSFLYHADNPIGWNQSHHQQYQQNQLDYFEFDDSNKLKFSDLPRDLKLRNYIYLYPSQYPRIYLDNKVIYDFQKNEANKHIKAVVVCVLDTIFAEPLINEGGGIYGNEGGDNRSKNVFVFSTENEQERSELIEFLDNVVPSGFYVGIMTVQRDSFESYKPEEWAGDTTNLGTSIFKVLEKQGVSQIQQLAQTGSIPYTLFYKKDDPSWPVQETFGDYYNVIEQNTVLIGVQDTAIMTTPLIGPSLKWNSVQWNVSQIDTTGYDNFNIALYGVKEDKTDSLILTTRSPGEILIDDIDAQRFPYMKMEFHAGDSLRRTPVQLDYWRIKYSEYPELALSPQSFYQFSKDTLAKGEPLQWKMAIENLSTTKVDSVKLRYRITDNRNNTSFLEQWLYNLEAKDTLHTSLNLATDTLENLYNLALELNPEKQPSERTYINNFGQIQTFVEVDRENPTLDVTFDGERILDGAIISAKPEILMMVRDNNPFSLLDDPADISVEIKFPNEDNWETIPTDDPNLTFEPAASGDKNEARLLFRPTFTTDGEYQLRVGAADKEGNESGQFDYQVAFQVITDTRLSNLVNYPNPFTTSTRFSYTLTGSEPIVDYKIQVLSVSGRIVRELTAIDLGILTPGTRLTEGAWDGTDTFGSPLAKGVYLYRFTMPDNGNAIETYQTAIDGFFTKGYGKMVILR